MSEDSTAAHRFNTTRGGAYFAVGRGGPITGRGANLLILDDLLKDWSEANSETIRRALHDWFSSVAYTRLAPGGAIVLIQTRWHEDDLAGRLLAGSSSEHWEVLSLPAIAERDESFRKQGESLWHAQFPLPELERKRSAIGEQAWVSLYQQRPTAAGGAIFKRDWWQFYKPPVAEPFNRIIQSYDTAFKRGSDNDYSVCTTWGVADTGYFLLHLFRGRVEFPELKRLLSSMAEQWKPHAILIEDRASGQSLVQELKHSTALPIIPVKVDTDKVARAQAVTPLMEAGKVFLPESASWLNDFIDEMASFPNGVHDDVVDSTTQALNYLRQQPDISLLELTLRVNFGSTDKIDKEEIWQRALMGLPISESEFDSL